MDICTIFKHMALNGERAFFGCIIIKWETPKREIQRLPRSFCPPARRSSKRDPVTDG